MSPTLWSFVAAFVAVGMEYLYRKITVPYWHLLPLWAVSGVIVSYAIYRLVTQPGVPLIGALVMWSFAVIGCRVFVTVVLLHDKVSPGTWVALGLMIAARIAQTVWK
jgi:hypothetical protein